jgi:hypothetical protein
LTTAATGVILSEKGKEQHAETHCRFAGKGERREFFGGSVSKQHSGRRIYSFWCWHGGLHNFNIPVARSYKMNGTVILLWLLILGLGAFGIYLKHKEDKK